MYAKLTRGGANSNDYWSFKVYAEDGTYISGGRSWWLRSADAIKELEAAYPGIKIRE